MQTIGNYLKSGREAKNIRLSEVARSTKISKWYLDCLEKDEYDKIPGGPYIKGYITSYASFIGIEEDEILKRYDSLQIDNTDENETQDQLIRDNKKNALVGFSISGKKMIIPGIAVLVILGFGFNHFFFADKTHLTANLQDTSESKLQPAPSSAMKQNVSRSIPRNNPVKFTKSDGVTRNSEDKINLKKEASHVPQKTNLAQVNQSNPIIAVDELHPEYQNDQAIDSPAILSSEQKIQATPEPIILGKKAIHAPKSTKTGPVIHDAPLSSENNSLKTIPGTESGKQTALTNSSSPSHQSTTQSAALSPESVTTHQTSDALPQTVNSMRVIKAVATSDIKNRNPEVTSNSFQWSTEKVYIWSMVECERPPSSIRHTYYFKGQKVNDIVLEVKSPQWRTWSYKTLLDKRYIGQWMVDITSGEGELLQRIFFDVN